MSSPLMKDYLWVRQSFLVKEEYLAKVDQQNRFFTTAALKFTDTTPGGNYAINPLPQFTETCDIPIKSLSGVSEMGRYYSEAIDDNMQVVHFRCGVPQFNSLTTFFTGFYNSGLGRLARTGRADGVMYTLGRATGFVVSLVAWPLLLVHFFGVGARFFLQKPASKFYYLKPTMPLYWNAVSTIVNHIAVNKGIVPRVLTDEVDQKLGGVSMTEDLRAKLHKALPDIFTESGGIDVYAMANRAQRLARKHKKRMDAQMAQSNGNFFTAVKNVYKEALLDDKKTTMEDYLQRWLGMQASQPLATTDATQAANSPGSEANSSSVASVESLQDYKEGQNVEDDGWMSFFEAELDDGSAFVSFRVQATGSVDESFSNSVTESEIGQQINGISSQSRATNFNFANGNIGGILGGAIDGIKDFASGVADSIGIQGLAALAGSAFVDIPKQWQNSTANLPRSTYTIELVSPYNNPISNFMNIHVPLAMLLAMALPLSTGKQSYTSPFIIEYYDQGRCQSRLAMVDSLSVTRGIGNLGFTNEGVMLGARVTLSLVDLSTVMHMPIAEGFSFNPAEGIFDDDTVFSDYMAVLAGMNLADQIYSWHRFKINLTKKLTDFNTWRSPTHIASFLANGDSVLSVPGRFMSMWYKGTER